MLPHPIDQAVEAPARDRRCRGGILDWLCKLYLILFRRPDRGDPCVYVPERVINRPDPCIYSQFLLMQLNQPITWDNAEHGHGVGC